LYFEPVTSSQTLLSAHFFGGTWFVSDRDIILILFEGLTIILLEMVLLDFLNALEEYIMIF